MKRLLQILIFIFIIFNTAQCIFFTDSVYDELKYAEFRKGGKEKQAQCQKDNLEYSLFLDLQKFNEFECKILVYGEEYKFQWIKSDYYSSSFIMPLNEIENYRIIPINVLAWMGLIPNYEERKINIAVKVFSKKGLLWEKEYYNYYEIWSSVLFLPLMPVQRFLLYKENIENQTLLATLEQMINDFKLRGLLEK